MLLPTFKNSGQPPGIPPGPRPRYPGQYIVEIARNPLAMMIAMSRDYGDIAHWKIGPQHIYLFSHPDLIRDVLVTNQKNFHKSRGLERAKRLLGNGLLTSEGDFHLRQRRLAQPAFHRLRIAAYAETMAHYAGRTSVAGAAPCLDLAVAAGVGRDLWDEECGSWVRLPPDVPRGSYVALKVAGESMQPLLHPGDTMLVRLEPGVATGDVVVARIDDDGFVVKRVGKVTRASIELLSVNPDFPPVQISRAGQPVVGTVVLCWCDHDLGAKRAAK